MPSASPTALAGLSPRVRGNQPPAVRPVTRHGSIPRVRGNPSRNTAAVSRHRSIPACTGKPMYRACRNRYRWVYPRVYGETVRDVLAGGLCRGLSPRVRGNRPRPCEQPQKHRSIPACTGKPASPLRTTPEASVYPRVYGETVQVTNEAYYAPGLSPRVRGNRSLLKCPANPGRSVAVYPRVYGETHVQDLA